MADWADYRNEDDEVEQEEGEEPAGIHLLMWLKNLSLQLGLRYLSRLNYFVILFFNVQYFLLTL